MFYLKEFKFFINESTSISQKSLLGMISGRHLDKVPAEALKEIFTWKIIQKSPYSSSFYDKEKSWNSTENGTIRISNHWNFFAKEKMHCQTIQDIGDQWAKGIYDSSVGKWNIVKTYKLSRNNRNLVRNLSHNLFQEYNSKMHSPELIQLRKLISLKIKDGLVTFYSDLVNGEVLKITPDIIEISVNGKKVKVDIVKLNDFTLDVDGEIIHKKELLDKKIIWD